MKILFAFAAAVMMIGATDANAQCFVQSNIINNGFNQNVFVPQSVVVPQSTAFFSGGNVAFVDQPQLFNQFGQAVVNQQFVNQPQIVQVIERRRGLFGALFGGTRVRTFVQPAFVQQSAFVQPSRVTFIGRRRIFIR